MTLDEDSPDLPAKAPNFMSWEDRYPPRAEPARRIKPNVFARMARFACLHPLVVIGLWWVALIFVILLVVMAGLLAWRGIKRVTSTTFTPEETIAAVKEDVEWAKTRLLRRG